MIFALANLPAVYDGQELSAATVNNLAQNTEILEQIVNGPDRLFLSNWAYAPPMFLFTNQTISGLYTFKFSEIDVWEGAFVYREGMHTVRIAFQSFPAHLQESFKPKFNLDADRAGSAINGICLFATFKYTDVPIREQINNQNKYAKYNFMWVYSANYNPTTPPRQIPLMTGLVRSHTGITYAEFDITGMNLTPGEVVPLKLRIAPYAEADGVRARKAEDYTSTYYFSMIYANIAHEVVPNTWSTLPTVTGLNQLATLVQNQQYLVNYFRLFDSPLRAAIWDQVLVGSSFFKFNYRDDNERSYHARYGLDSVLTHHIMSRCAQQARYYVQKKFSLKDTVSISYSASTNTSSKFSMQGILSKEATNAGWYRYDEGNDNLSNNPYWGITQQKPNNSNIVSSNQEAQFNNSKIGRQGLLQTMGADSQFPATGITPPAGFPDAGYLLFYKNSSSAQNKLPSPVFNGFYFINPSTFNPVSYYNNAATSVLGTRTDFFTRGGSNDALYFSDTFNFKLVAQSANASRFYPLIYQGYTGLSAHSTYYIEDSDEYTDFSIDLKENAPVGTIGNGVKTNFNKANYIGTIRITDASVRNGSYSLTTFTRYNAFDTICYSGLINHLQAINQRLNQVKTMIDTLHSYKYIPLFWTKPKSFINHHDKVRDPKSNDSDRFFSKLERATVYFSNTRQADYLVVRGTNVRIGWGGFDKVYRDNPQGLWPAPLTFEFINEQNLCGDTLETIVIGFDSLEGLAHGERYFLEGSIMYAAETMGVP